MLVLIPFNNPMSRHLVQTRPSDFGWLVTPRRMIGKLRTEHACWAADNDCFNFDNFEPEQFKKYCRRLITYPSSPLFVTVPDCVGNAEITHQLWKEWSPFMFDCGLPLAYVAQDGLVELPNENFNTLFIGGTTEYKLGPNVRTLIRRAKDNGLWVHMGRVNSRKRMNYAFNLGVDSVDGTFSRSPNHSMKHISNTLSIQQKQLPLEILPWEGTETWHTR